MKIKVERKFSKSERLIYIIIFLWIVYGILGIMYDANLTQLAGYYASLTLFISTYLWGEHKRTSNSSYVLAKGRSSSREIVIYVTVLLWCVLGAFGILTQNSLNSLTVYFTSLTPFVSSYIIYKTTKGNDLPIFNGKSQELIDNARNSVDVKSSPIKNDNITNNEKNNSSENKEVKPKEDEGNVEDEVF